MVELEPTNRTKLSDVVSRLLELAEFNTYDIEAMYPFYLKRALGHHGP